MEVTLSVCDDGSGIQPQVLTRLANALGETVVVGGSDYDGAELGSLDRDAVARFASSIGDVADAIAITGVFSPVSADHELEAAEIVRRDGELVSVDAIGILN